MFLMLLFCIILLISTETLISIDAQENGSVSCSRPFQCGRMQAKYPFWGMNRGYYCGESGYKLHCQQNVTFLTMISQKYRVLAITDASKTLTIAREDYWDTYCPKQFANTTLDYSHFDYAPGLRNLTLLYACSSSLTRGIPNAFNQGNCDTGDSEINLFYFTTNVSVNPLVGSCQHRVRVPVSEEAAQGLDQRTTNLTQALNGGFDVRWIKGDNECDPCKESGGICGRNLTTSQFSCFCHNLTNLGTLKKCPGPTTQQGSNWKMKPIIGLISGAVGLSLICIICCCFRRMKAFILLSQKLTKNERDLEAFIRNHGLQPIRRYSFTDVKKMTNSFQESLGKGGYGSVYKGKLRDNSLVAVKVLNPSKRDGEEFINEVASISRTSHVNIVTLLGYCIEGQKRALIYEFMPNGSLEKFIYNDNPLTVSQDLGWEKVFQIAMGIAQGLEYLHRGCKTRILHFDIKPHNILLDEDFCPKISDFGLAKLSTRKESIVSMMEARGTIGYIAPEVVSRNFGHVSHKSDVYSYGMMILEMVGRRKNINVGTSHTSEIYFPHWVYDQLKTGEHLRLPGIANHEENEMAKKMALAGLWCIQTSPLDRPCISEVIEMLKGSMEDLQVPPKPFITSPERSPLRTSSRHMSQCDSTT